jgi:3-hydroxyacyl-[acyl-carrier-protein] dehydratase
MTRKQLSLKEIAEILPHRYPFLLVDKILDIDLENNTILGQKNLTANEEFFQGHFPGAPIMPGVLILESMAQTGGVLLHEKGHKDRLALFLNINKAKFRQPIRPGDILFNRMEGIFFSGKGGRVKGEARINSPDGPLAAQAELGFALVPKEMV